MENRVKKTQKQFWEVRRDRISLRLNLALQGVWKFARRQKFMSYYGFDKSDYPGDNVMQIWWINSPFYFVGFYLAPAPHHTNTGWMNKRATLKSQGWGFLPIYISDSNINCTGYSNAQCNKTYGGYALSMDLDVTTSKDPSVY